MADGRGGTGLVLVLLVNAEEGAGAEVALDRRRPAPVVNAVDADAGLEQVGVTGECLAGEQAAVGAAPDADLVGVDAGLGGEPAAGGEHVAIFGRVAPGPARCVAEGAAIADARAVIDGEHR